MLPRSRSKIYEQAGNTIHLNVFGIVWLYILAHCSPEIPTDFILRCVQVPRLVAVLADGDEGDKQDSKRLRTEGG